MRLILLFVIATLGLTGLTLGYGPVQAQGKFAAVVTVNDRAITRFELDQRILMNKILQTPGNLEQVSRKQLIDDRLKLDAGAAAGISVTEEQINAGMDEFAGRAKLKREQFIKVLAQSGVAETTFRDFVRAGLIWREIVRTRFVSRVQISDAEVDRAVAQSGTTGGIRVLLSEIILPADIPERAAASQAQAAQITKITSFAGFSNAAQKYSVSPTNVKGGRLNWLPLANLPPAIRPLILALRPGEVSAPVPLPNAIAIFQLRAIEETSAAATKISAIEFARFYVQGDSAAATLAAATAMRGRVDTCDDLYGLAKGMPKERLSVDTMAVGDIPQDVALELAKLDPNEVSTALTSGGGKTRVFLMLCGRTPALADTVSRADVRTSLVNQRFESYASAYLAELQADAVITVK